MRGAPRVAAAPVAKASSVSEVEVSPSIVTALKVSSTPRSSSACSTAGSDRRIGEHEGQHRRHVGRDHAGALGDAVDRDRRVAEPRRARSRTFGKVSVVMIALAASMPARRAPRRRRGRSITAVELRRVERLADHAGRGEENFRRLAARGLGGDLGRQLGRGAARLPGEGIGVAGIDHQRARLLPPLRLGAAPIDRRRRAFRAREDAGDRRARIEQRQQHVGAARVPDAGRRSGERARRRPAAFRERTRARAAKRRRP